MFPLGFGACFVSPPTFALGYVWFPENTREIKFEGKMEGKKKLRKGI